MVDFIYDVCVATVFLLKIAIFIGLIAVPVILVDYFGNSSWYWSYVAIAPIIYAVGNAFFD